MRARTHSNSSSRPSRSPASGRRCAYPRAIVSNCSRTSSKSGRVYRLTPPYTRPEVLVTLEDYPHSVALRGDEMLIAETNGLYRTFYRPGQARILPQDVK